MKLLRGYFIKKWTDLQKFIEVKLKFKHLLVFEFQNSKYFELFSQICDLIVKNKPTNSQDCCWAFKPGSGIPAKMHQNLLKEYMKVTEAKRNLEEKLDEVNMQRLDEHVNTLYYSTLAKEKEYELIAAQESYNLSFIVSFSNSMMLAQGLDNLESQVSELKSQNSELKKKIKNTKIDWDDQKQTEIELQFKQISEDCNRLKTMNNSFLLNY